jgi:diguanylate cyclase (GGDEF)-like protein
MNRLRSWARIAPLPLTVKLMAVNVLLVVSLAAVVLVAWRMLPAEADAAADVILLTNAQRANQTADMLHDALRSDVLASLLAGQAPGITVDSVRQSLRTHAHEFRSEVARLNKMPLKPEARQYVVEAYISALHYVAVTEQHVELGLTNRVAALAEVAAFETAFEEAKTAFSRQSDALARASDEVQATSRAAAEVAQRWLALAAAVSVFVGWACVALVARSIRRSLTSLSEVAVAIADGHLERRSVVGTKDEVGLLASSINQMADRLHEMIERTRRDAEQGSFGRELVEALEMADSEPRAHAVVARAMAEISPSHAMELLLADSSNAQLERAAEHPELGAPGCMVDAAFSCSAVRRGHTLQFAHSGALNACPALRGRPEGARSAACVPVTFMGRALGVLHATGDVGAPLSAHQLQRLSTLGAQAGSRIGTVRAFERTQLQAATDSLTGLANRRTAEARMRQWFQEGRSFSLVMCDLDHFKRLNDTHGHPAGDDALRSFAETVRACARGADLLARWGGEEFAFLLADMAADDAVAWTDRVRQMLAQMLRAQAKPIFTASFGITTADAAPTPELLVRRADDALYRAKAEGRDRAVLAEALPVGDPESGFGPARGASEHRATLNLQMMAAQE